MNVLIIGGDAAGMSAASRAKRQRPDLTITVLEKTMDVSYSACGMPYAIADPNREMDELVVRHADVFREKQGIHLLTDHWVETIDRKAQTVSGVIHGRRKFDHPYDKLLIATGASPVVPDLPGFDLPGVMVLKSLEDGRRIKRFLRSKPVQKAVIIGMGYIALEICEALRALDIGVDMVKPRPVFLPWMERELAKVVQDELEAEGVTLYPGNAVEGIEASGDRLQIRCGEVTLEGDMVLAAVGVTPNSGIAARAGLDLSVDNAVSVDKFLNTSDEHIYAAGDCADAFHEVTGKKAWVPLALRANRAGWAVADNICGKKTELRGIVGTAVFKVFNLEVASTGLNVAQAAANDFDPISTTIQSRSRAHAHPGSSIIWVHMVGDARTGRLLGVQMVGREGVAHRINAPAVALHGGMTVEQFSASDLAYAPPFGPVWDPLLTAANQLVKKL